MKQAKAMKPGKHRILVTRFPFSSRFGGEEVHTLRLMGELDKRGHEITFLGSDPVLHEQFEARGFEHRKTWFYKAPVSKGSLLIFTLLSPLLFLMAGWKLRRAVKNWKVDTVYMLSLGEKLMMTFWAKRFGLNVVWLEHARIGPWLTKNPWRAVYRRLSRHVHCVVTSKAMTRFVQPFAKHVTAIPCGLMLVKKAPLRQSIQDFLKGGFAMGTVARLSVDKGVDKIVRLVDNKPDSRLIIIGDGSLAESIQKRAREDRVMLLPSLPRTELMGLYEALDLFILGSTQMDPFGLVAIEAMAMGAPVLLTDQCGVASELMHERDAYIVSPQYSQLDKAVKILMRRSKFRNEMARHGKSFVTEHFKLSTMVDRFEQVFDEPIPSTKTV